MKIRNRCSGLGSRTIFTARNILIGLLCVICILLSECKALEIDDQCGTTYLNCEDVDREISSKVVREVPVSNYFDTLGGQYRFGILGDHVKTQFPELTQIVERPINKRDKSTQTVQFTALDSNAVFMHSLVETQWAISHLNEVEAELEQITLRTRKYSASVDELLKRFDSQMNSKSLADIREQYALAQLEQMSILDEIQHIRDMAVASRSVAAHRLASRKANMLTADARLTSQLKTHFEVLRNISFLKLEGINQVLIDEMQSQFNMSVTELNREVALEIMALEQDITSAIRAAKFRIEEESEIERRNEDVHAHILHAKEDSRRKASNEMIVVFFQELQRYSALLLDNPQSILFWSSNLLLVISLFVVVVEVVKESKNMLLNSLTAPFGLVFLQGRNSSKKKGGFRFSAVGSTALTPQQHNVERIRNAVSADLLQLQLQLIGNSDALKELVLVKETMDSVVNIAATLSCVGSSSSSTTAVSTASTETNQALSQPGMFVRLVLSPFIPSPPPTALPNTLIVGPGGSGKSMVAKALAEASGLPYAILSGADLEAHGSRASAYLRVVLDKLHARSASRRCLLVIDDPENITEARRQHHQLMQRPPMIQQENSNSSWEIASISSGISGINDDDVINVSRGGSDVLNTTTSTNAIPHCLYVLLQAIRMNSTKFGIILTSRQDLSGIDTALLDRMDNIITLQLPAREQRLMLVLSLVNELLFNYLDDENKNKFARLITTNGSELDIPDQHDSATALVSMGNGSSSSRSRRMSTRSTQVDNGGGFVSLDDVRRRVQQQQLQSSQLDLNGSSSTVFDVTAATSLLVRLSHGWSCREIRKVVQNIQSSILGSDRCELTNKIWQNEINYWVEQRMKAQMNNC